MKKIEIPPQKRTGHLALSNRLLWQVLVAELIHKGVLDRDDLERMKGKVQKTPLADLAVDAIEPLLSGIKVSKDGVD